jgi:hypothetical protein
MAQISTTATFFDYLTVDRHPWRASLQAAGYNAGLGVSFGASNPHWDHAPISGSPGLPHEDEWIGYISGGIAWQSRVIAHGNIYDNVDTPIRFRMVHHNIATGKEHGGDGPGGEGMYYLGADGIYHSASVNDTFAGKKPTFTIR